MKTKLSPEKLDEILAQRNAHESSRFGKTALDLCHRAQEVQEKLVALLRQSGRTVTRRLYCFNPSVGYYTYSIACVAEIDGQKVPYEMLAIIPRCADPSQLKFVFGFDAFNAKKETVREGKNGFNFSKLHDTFVKWMLLAKERKEKREEGKQLRHMLEDTADSINKKYLLHLDGDQQRVRFHVIAPYVTHPSEGAYLEVSLRAKVDLDRAEELAKAIYLATKDWEGLSRGLTPDEVEAIEDTMDEAFSKDEPPSLEEATLLVEALQPTKIASTVDPKYLSKTIERTYNLLLDRRS